MKKILFIILLSHLNILAFSQIIKGTVFDEKTKSVIYSASIYFNGTSSGVLSDPNGNFVLDVTKYASMPMTISALGYFSTAITDFANGKPVIIYLKPKLFELNEVVVNAKSHSRERRENLVTFRNEFLGINGNAMNCEITNENDIKFIYGSDNDTLKAYATNPINIENKALGYKITYYLDKFEYCKQNETFSFTGNMIFREDSATGLAQKQLFERKRKNAYLGSRMHFIRSLWLDNLNSAGFTVKNSANETLKYNKIVYMKDSRTKYLKYVGDLGISYYSTKAPASYIIFLKTMVYFDANGYFDPSGISWEGEMAKQRIADMLPYDYSVKE